MTERGAFILTMIIFQKFIDYIIVNFLKNIDAILRPFGGGVI